MQSNLILWLFAYSFISPLFGEELSNVENDLQNQATEMSKIAKESSSKSLYEKERELEIKERELILREKEIEIRKQELQLGGDKTSKQEKGKLESRHYLGITAFGGGADIFIQDDSGYEIAKSSNYSASGFSLKWGIERVSGNRYEWSYNEYSIDYDGFESESFGVGFDWFFVFNHNSQISSYINLGLEYVQKDEEIYEKLNGVGAGLGIGLYYKPIDKLEFSIGYEIRVHSFDYEYYSCENYYSGYSYYSQSCQNETLTLTEDMTLFKFGINYFF
jgi:hypothetical protein